jgi:hypothetical protein
MGIVSTPPALLSTTVKRRSRAVMRSGVFTVSAIRNPQIAEEKKSLMDGKKSADDHSRTVTLVTARMSAPALLN